MPKTRAQKEKTVSELSEQINQSQSMVFVDFRGLNAKDTADLRKLARKEAVPYTVVKKTLLKIAFAQGQVTGVDEGKLVGNIAVAFGTSDAVAPAKFLTQFAKTHEAVKILGGVFEKKFMDVAQVKALAALPSKQELLGQLVGVLQAPISGLVNVFAGNFRGLIQVLKAKAEQQGVQVKT